jgi:hypothetical protein
MSQERAHGAAGRRVEAEIRRRFRPYIRLFDRANDLAKSAVEQSVTSPEETRKLVCAALYGRLIRSTQSGVLLALRGLQHDAIACLRISLELLVYLKRCSESDAFVKAYLRTNLLRKQKLANASQLIAGKSASEKAELKKIAEHWKRLAVKAGAKPLVFEQVCRDAGMSDHYNTVYRLTSDPVHAAPRILDDIAVKKDGALSELDFGPRTDRFVLNLVSFTEFLLDATQHYSQVAGVNEEKRLNRLRRDLSKIVPKWG